MIVLGDGLLSEGCGNLFLSLISVNAFKTTVSINLSSNFASFQIPQPFSVKNSQDASVGVLIGDGAQVECFIITVYIFRLILMVLFQNTPYVFKQTIFINLQHITSLILELL